MADFREYHRKGVVVKYFPDTKVLMLQPGKKAQKDDFLRLKSKLDTLLQIEGTKRVGNTFTLKLDKNFNVNIDEVLKSLGMRGGIEHEDAQSMVDDAAEDAVEEQEKEQAPDEAQPISPMENVARRGVYAFLFEDDLFQPGPKKVKKKRAVKRPGEYWKPLERQTGKNRNALSTDDILALRKKFSIKPPSDERDEVLKSLDKAVNYFYQRIMADEGEDAAFRFDEEYKAIDNLRPSDYGGEEEIDNNLQSANMDDSGLSLTANFDDLDYSDIHIENE